MSHDGPPTGDDNSIDFDPNAMQEIQAQNAAASEGDLPAGVSVYAEQTPVDIDLSVAAEATPGEVVALPSQEAAVEEPAQVLETRAEAVATAEKSEYESFKGDIKQRFSGFTDKAGALWGRLKGAVSTSAGVAGEAALATAYAVYKTPDVVAAGANYAIETGANVRDAAIETVTDARDAVAKTYQGARTAAVETYQDAKSSVVETITGARDAAVETYQGVKTSAVEGVVAGKEAVVGGAKAVGRGVETAALLTVGAGILAGEAIGRGVNNTVELGARGVAAGQRMAERGAEKANEAKENAIKKMTEVKDKTVQAVSSVARAAEMKTTEAVNAGREYIRSGVASVVEAGTALKERAKDGLNSAWEKLKMKKNAIKRGLIMAKVGYHQSQGQRFKGNSAAMDAKAQTAFAKANKAFAGRVAIEG